MGTLHWLPSLQLQLLPDNPVLTMDLASLYIILGSISFITSVVTLGVLIKKFIEQPAAHGFFAYSDTIASALLSLGLLLDGVISLKPSLADKNCYQFKLLYGLFVVAIVTGFFSVLGMAIERFQAFAVYKNHRHITRKFSIGWFLSSWTLAILFVMILLTQIISEDEGSFRKNVVTGTITRILPKISKGNAPDGDHSDYFPASNIFPGPHMYDLAEVTEVTEITETETETVPEAVPEAEAEPEKQPCAEDGDRDIPDIGGVEELKKESRPNDRELKIDKRGSDEKVLLCSVLDRDNNGVLPDLDNRNLFFIQN